MSPRSRTCASLVCACIALGGCSTKQVQRAAYQVLRQEDCRLNQLESFCRRNFANEFLDYERMRRAFMREESGDTWRVDGRDAAVDAVVAESIAGLAPPVATASAARTVSDASGSATDAAAGTPVDIDVVDPTDRDAANWEVADWEVADWDVADWDVADWDVTDREVADGDVLDWPARDAFGR